MEEDFIDDEKFRVLPVSIHYKNNFDCYNCKLFIHLENKFYCFIFDKKIFKTAKRVLYYIWILNNKNKNELFTFNLNSNIFINDEKSTLKYDFQTYVSLHLSNFTKLNDGSINWSQKQCYVEMIVLLCEKIEKQSKLIQKLLDKNNVESKQCKICLKKVVNIINIPCGHLYQCKECLKLWNPKEKGCMICQNCVSDYFQVYSDFIENI